MTIIQLCMYGIARYLVYRFDKKENKNQETNVDKIDDTHNEEQHGNEN